MKKLLILLPLALLLSLCSCAAREAAPTQVPAMADPVNDNYRTFYQIFVGSFADGNGDGIGDLRGIINRFDYLNDGNVNSTTSLGVQGIWLSPIFTSPSYHKYDAKNYYEVDWRFGTEADLKELAELCHSRNVKLILDLAINHTSDQHPWFQQFKAARAAGDTADPYYDFYSGAATADKLGGVSYQKIAGCDYWYECNFSGSMPELNFDNETVREEVVKLAKYYLDLGIDGFRFDAVKYIYYGDAARSIDFWHWYMDELRALSPDIYCVGECWSGDSEVLAYYEALNCFNFTMSQSEGVIAAAARGSSLAKFTGYVTSFQESIANIEGAMFMPFLSNHDMDRAGGFFATEGHVKMAASLYLLTPGSPFIYYGEEIGIRGSRGSENTDANRRLAMLWGDDSILRDPEGSTYPAKNQISTTVATQSADENSVLNHYRRLLTLRHTYPQIARGTYTAVSTSEKNVGGFRIDYQGETTLLLHNTALEPLTLDLSTLKNVSVTQLLTSLSASNTPATLTNTTLTLPAQSTALLK